ncbi:MAG: hypothetical protein CMF60_06870 [Magnetococcales bacterium]|nr:hypothetical protein [Magnetococcales bacterium]|tara:strand:+ start:5201 stop:6184 length:984 start_codon:yes stop_codon:yes gene_type:complete
MPAKKAPKFNPKSIQKMEYTVISFMLLFGVAFVALSFLTGAENVWQKLTMLNLSTWLTVISLSIINYCARGLKWHLFAQKLQLGVPIRRLFLYYFSGMSMTVTPGKVGTGIRLWFFQRCHQVRYARSLPLMVMDPITDLAALLILCVIGGLSFTAGGQNTSVIALCLITFVAVVFLNKPSWISKTIKALYSLTGKRKKRLFASLQRLAKNITQLVSPWLFIKTVALSLLGWAAMALSFQMILNQMGADLTFLQCGFIFSFAIILGSATMSPGGLGGTEATMIALLATLNIPLEIAVPATVVIRFTTLWLGVLIGFAHLPFSMKLAKK